MSSTSDLASPTDDLLYTLAAYIVRRSGGAKQNAVSALSRYITVAYTLGAGRAGDEVQHHDPVGLQGLDPVIDRLGKTLDDTFGSLSGELTTTVEKGIQNGWTYARTREELATQIKAGWGKTITFNRVGQTRRVAWVKPDGTMEWRKKTIRHKITLPVDTYADTLARTNIKAAYARGHLQRYQDSGRKGWVYLAAADERTRPHHLVLHGRVFIFGSPEEEQALAVMEEANCRCRPKAYFGDPDLDTDPEVYAQERKEWAQQAYDELPDAEKEGGVGKFLQEMIREGTSEGPAGDNGI